MEANQVGWGRARSRSLVGLRARLSADFRRHHRNFLKDFLSRRVLGRTKNAFFVFAAKVKESWWFETVEKTEQLIRTKKKRAKFERIGFIFISFRFGWRQSKKLSFYRFHLFSPFLTRNSKWEFKKRKFASTEHVDINLQHFISTRGFYSGKGGGQVTQTDCKINQGEGQKLLTFATAGARDFVLPGQVGAS